MGRAGFRLPYVVEKALRELSSISIVIHAFCGGKRRLNSAEKFVGDELKTRAAAVVAAEPDTRSQAAEANRYQDELLA